MKAIIEHLALITQIHGSPVAAEALTAQVVRDANMNINYQSLIEVLRSYGFDSTISKRALADIPSLSVPVVVMLQNEEAAVITKIEGEKTNRTYHILQSDGLAHTVSSAELESKYLGYCWFIKPRISVDNRSELAEYRMEKAWFWKVIWRFKAYYYQVILATFIINFLALVSSLYVMNVYDRVIPNKSYETLWALSIGVILAIIFEFIARMIRGHLTDIAGKKADLIISSALFRRILSIRLADKPVSAGSYANNLREFESVRDFMTSASLLVLVDLPFLLLFLFVIYLVGGALAFVPAVIIPLVILVGLIVQPKLVSYMNESMKESSQRQGLVVETIDGLETLKINNATNWAQQRWDTYTAKISASQTKTKDLSNLVINFAAKMQQLNTVALVIVGTYLIHAEDEASRITMGALIASVILSGRALAPLAQVAGLATRFQQARLALEGINNIVERPSERKADKKYITLKQVRGDVTFNNISFKYDKGDADNALDGISINIKAGEKVGILGRVGSGKSTLLKLASGLYEPNRGSVTLDGIDIRQLDPNYLRNQVASLEQSPRLFLGTLRDNLDLARTDNYASDQELLTALNRFGLINLVQKSSRGLDMFIGENGQGLSGGQKQLVALARLTLRDPRVVLLDEPTSNLDQGSEINVLRALAQWMRDRTMILVTHRPQALQLVNRIIVVDNGKIVLDGPRDAVLAKLAENEQKAMEQHAQTNKQQKIVKKTAIGNQNNNSTSANKE